jgi:hypothetical protein
LGEYLLYNGELSVNQVSQIENYLMAKWAVTPCNVGSGIQPMNKTPSVAAQPFTPACVTGLALWLDANDPYGSNYIPANSTSLPIWYDKSGNLNNASNGVSPFYANNSLVFDGSSFLDTTLTAKPAYETIFVVCLMAAPLSGSFNMVGHLPLWPLGVETSHTLSACW